MIIFLTLKELVAVVHATTDPALKDLPPGTGTVNLWDCIIHAIPILELTKFRELSRKFEALICLLKCV